MTTEDDTYAARMRSLARLVRPTAHELRGALSALQVHLELLSGTLDAEDEGACARRRRYLDVVRGECARVHQLADTFFDLAALPAERAEGEVGTLVAAVIGAAKPLAIERRVRLEVGTVAADSGRVLDREGCRQRVLDAVIEAVAKAPSGSVVRVELRSDGKGLSVEVEGESRVDVRLEATRGRADA